MKKYYYCIKFKLNSPLVISNGDNDNTDKDLMKDNLGRPFIPASSLAGIYRTLLFEEEANKYFGYVEINKGDKEDTRKKESEFIIYDATLIDDSFTISTRDGIELDELKTTKKGSKYDYEVLEADCSFQTYIEINEYNNNDVKAVISKLLNAINSEQFVLGAKTTRGYGTIKDIEISEINFDLDEHLDEWLNFDIYSDQNNWKEYKIENQNNNFEGIKIDIKLKLLSPLSIREYITEVDDVDYRQIRYRKDNKPFIPGTSWAGLFRHNIIRINKDLENIFSEKNRKSKIIFSESVIENAKEKTISRNAIDRFSGGTVDGALFKEEVIYEGDTTLTIRIDKEYKENKELLRAICITIADLKAGFIALGGETSIGHGLFDVVEVKINENTIINNNDINDFYKNLIKELTDE